MTYNCLIVDDEPIARKILMEYIDALPDFQVVEQLGNPVEVPNYLSNNKIDLLFLDINMPRLNGIQLLKNIENPPLVIFTTAYSEYAVDAFELEAFDYLVKPIAFDRFMKALNRAKKRLEEGSRTQNSPLLFSIKEGKRLYKVDFETIFLIQAFGDYVRIHTAEKVYITKSKFIHIKAELPHYFLQVHRSYIINLNFLKYVEGNHLLVHKEKIPISNTYREELMKVL